MKLYVKNSFFDIMMSLAAKNMVKTAQTPPAGTTKEEALPLSSSSLGLYPDIKDKIIKDDTSGIGNTVIPRKISKNETYKNAVNTIIDTLKGDISQSSSIRKIDDVIASLVQLKSTETSGDTAGNTPATPRRGRPPKNVTTADVDLSKLDPSLLPGNTPNPAGTPPSPVSTPTGLVSITKQDSAAIDNAIKKLEELKSLVQEYETKFLDTLKKELFDPANAGKTINEILWMARNDHDIEQKILEISEKISGTEATKETPRTLGLVDYLSNESIQKPLKASGKTNAIDNVANFVNSSTNIANTIRGQLNDKGELIVESGTGTAKKIVDRNTLISGGVDSEYDPNAAGDSRISLVKILTKRDIRKDFQAFYSKLTPAQQQQYQQLKATVDGSFQTKDSRGNSVPPTTTVSADQMEELRNIMKNIRLEQIRELFGNTYGELVVEENLDISSLIKTVASQIHDFIESTGPASKATGFGQEAHLNNKGEMVVNGDVVDQDWVDGVRDAIAGLARNLGVALSGEETNLLSSNINPLTNPKYALFYIFLNDFFNLYSEDYFNDMTWNEVQTYLNKNFPDPIFGLCEKIIRSGRKYKIVAGTLDKPFQVEPNGYVFIKSNKGVVDYVVFKFGSVTSGLYTIGYRELLDFMKTSKSTIDNLLQQNKVKEAAEMLYKGAMKYAYIRELIANGEDFDPMQSKFAKSQFFNEISKISDQEALIAKRMVRMLKLAQSTGVITNPEQLASAKANLEIIKKALENLKKDPEKNAGVIPSREKQIALLEKQISDYEKTHAEGAELGGKVSPRIETPQQGSRPHVSIENLPNIKTATDEEKIAHYLDSIKDLIMQKVDLFDGDIYSLRNLQLNLEGADGILDELLSKYQSKLTPEQKTTIDTYRKEIHKKLNVLDPIVERTMEELQQGNDTDEDAEEVMAEIEQQIKDREGDMAKVIELLEFVPDRKQNIARAKANLRKHPRLAIFLESTDYGKKFLQELKHAEELLQRKAF